MMSPLGGFLIQSRAGANGNFEAVIPWPDGGLAHYARANDNDEFRWLGPNVFGTGKYVGATVIESDFRLDPERRLGNLEVLATRDDGIVHAYWRDNVDFVWKGPALVATPAGETLSGVRGAPSMAYSGAYFRAGGTGHHDSSFYVAVPDMFAGFEYWERFNGSNFDGSDNIRWSKLFGAGQQRLVGVGMTSLAMGSTHFTDTADTGYADVGPGEERIVAGVTVAGLLELHVRWITDASGHSVGWIDRTTFGQDVFPELAGEFRGRPCLIQGDFGWEPEGDLPFDIGHFGNLELVVASNNGGLLHFFRDCGNRQDGFIPIGEAPRWHQPLRISGPLYDEVSLIQSNFGGEHGNLEMIARRRHQHGFDFYFRGEDLTWRGPQRIGTLIRDPKWGHRVVNAGETEISISLTNNVSLASWFDPVTKVEHIAWGGEDGGRVNELRRRLGGLQWRHSIPNLTQTPGSFASVANLAERLTKVTGWHSKKDNVDYIAYHSLDNSGGALHICSRTADSEIWEHSIPGVELPGIFFRTGPISWYDFDDVNHVAYAGKDNQIHEWFRKAGTSGGWQHSIPNFLQPEILQGTTPTACTTHGGQIAHLIYVGADGHLRECIHRIIPADPRWETRVILPHVTAVAPVPTTSWCSTPANIQHFAFSLEGLVHQRFFFHGGFGGWRHEICNSPEMPAGKGGLTSWYTSPENVQHIAYVGTDSQVHECYFHVEVGGDGTWRHTVPSFGQQPAAPGQTPTSWVTSDNVEHIAYIGTDGKIHECFHETQ